MRFSYARLSLASAHARPPVRNKKTGGGYAFIGETLFRVSEQDDGFYAELVGVIKNVSDTEWTECTITFSLQEINGAELCRATASVGALRSGEAKLFKACPVSLVNASPCAFKLVSVEYKQ